jgi:TPR repeat protein
MEWFELERQATCSTMPLRIELGRLFARGEGVSVDRKAALEWYSSAIAIAPPEGFANEVNEAPAFVARAG